MSAQEWEPGDPLYRHPSERDYGDGNYVRHLIDLVSDEASAVHLMLGGVAYEAVCTHCLVGWPASEGPDCWMCGKPADNYDDAWRREQGMRESNEDVAILMGGPGDGLRHHVEFNDPTDLDHAYVETSERAARTYIIHCWSQPPGEHWVRHRYVRTAEWDNRRSGFRFRYEGEVTDGA